MARHFGPVPGVPVGKVFADRMALHDAGIHKPTMAGISGSMADGADSIVASGGYEDDDDRGDVLIYTGHGGNDIETAKQVADQELYRGNLALAVSEKKGLAVRVVRGSKLRSGYAPRFGYRYDGLYEVVRHWSEQGKSGHLVWRFELRRLSDQAPGPW